MASTENDDASLPTVDDAGRSRRRIGALLLAVAFVAGAGGYVVGRGRPPSARSADVGFMQDMIVHHEQAVAMAFETVDDAVDPEVHGFAKDILMSQQYEIGLMEAYLRRDGYPRDSGRATATAWMGMRHDKDAMPGMATAEDLDRLAKASGPELDDQFLRLMIAHHRGGVAMAEAAVARVNDTELRHLAERIRRAQQSEIAEMEATRQRLALVPVSDDGGEPATRSQHGAH